MIRNLQLWCQLKLTELRYRLGRISKQRYRFESASRLENLGHLQQSIDHYEQFLLVTPDDTVKSRLAFCYGEVGEWEKSVDTYKNMKNVWGDPIDALGLVLSELHSGRPDAAQKTLNVIELMYGHRSGVERKIIDMLSRDISVHSID